MKTLVMRTAEVFLNCIKREDFPDIQVTVAHILRDSKNPEEMLERFKQIVETEDEENILPELKKIRASIEKQDI